MVMGTRNIPSAALGNAPIEDGVLLGGCSLCKVLGRRKLYHVCVQTFAYQGSIAIFRPFEHSAQTIDSIEGKDKAGFVSIGLRVAYIDGTRCIS
jgi:hypothetical protein